MWNGHGRNGDGRYGHGWNGNDEPYDDGMCSYVLLLSLHRPPHNLCPRPYLCAQLYLKAVDAESSALMSGWNGRSWRDGNGYARHGHGWTGNGRTGRYGPGKHGNVWDGNGNGRNGKDGPNDGQSHYLVCAITPPSLLVVVSYSSVGLSRADTQGMGGMGMGGMGMGGMGMGGMGMMNPMMMGMGGMGMGMGGMVSLPLLLI